MRCPQGQREQLAVPLRCVLAAVLAARPVDRARAYTADIKVLWDAHAGPGNRRMPVAGGRNCDSDGAETGGTRAALPARSAPLNSR